MRFSDPRNARTINRLRVLNLIREQQDLSRADISRILLLNKVSVSEIVDALLQEGLILETGKQINKQAGRNSISLSLEKKAAYLLVMDIGRKNTTLGIVTIAGDIVRFERFPSNLEPPQQENPNTPPLPSRRREDLAQKLFTYAGRLAVRFKEPEKIMGLSISLSNTILSEPADMQPSIENYLENILRERLQIPVVINNSMRAMTLAEHWFQTRPSTSRLLYINWGHAIEAAHKNGHSIYAGDNAFGHIYLGGGNQCRCGKTGCLEAYSSGWYLQKQGQELLQTQEPVSVKQLAAASLHHKGVQELLIRAARGLGRAIATAADICAPQTIIVAGGISGLADSYFAELTAAYRASVHYPAGQTVLPEKSTLGDKAAILGAAAYGLDKLLYRRTLLERLQDAESFEDAMIEHLISMK